MRTTAGDGTLAAPDAAAATAPPPDRIAGGISWLLAANVVYAASLWLVVVIASRTSTTVLGQYALAMAFVSPLHLLFRGNLRELRSTDASRHFSTRDYERLRVVGNGAFITTCALAAVVVPYPAPVRWTIAVLAVAKVVDSWSDLAYGLFQQQGDTRTVAVSYFLRSAVAVPAAAVGLLVTRSPVGLVAGLGIGWAVALFLHDLPSIRRAALPRREAQPSGGPPPGSAIRRALSAAAPLGVVAMLLSLIHNLPRYFIERQLGFSAVGAYVSISYLLVAAASVGAAIGQGRAAAFGRLWAEGRGRDLRRTVFVTVAALGGLCVLAALVALPSGGPLLAFLYGSAFRGYGTEAVLACLAALPAVTLPVVGAALTAAHRRAAQAVTLVIGTVVVAVASPPLIARDGMAGALIALVIGLAATLLGQLLVLVSATRDLPAQGFEGSST